MSPQLGNSPFLPWLCCGYWNSSYTSSLCGHVLSSQLDRQLLKGKNQLCKVSLRAASQRQGWTVKSLLPLIITRHRAQPGSWWPPVDTDPLLPKWPFQGISGPESSLSWGSSDISNTQVPQDSLLSWMVLTAHKKWFHSECYPPGCGEGVGQTSQKPEECLKGQINERSEGRLWIPIQVLGKGLSVVWWKGLDVGLEGERDSTCPLPPAAGGLRNNEAVARQWHVGGSWLQLIENRPFVLQQYNCAHGPAQEGCKAGQGGGGIYVCMCVCEMKPSFFTF